MMTLRSLRTRISARNSASATASRVRHLPYDPSRGWRSSANEPAPGGSPAQWRHAPRDYVLLIIFSTFIGRLILASTIGLGVDESYQASVSQPLSLSYFDHPPLSFWIPGVVELFTGSASGVLLRLPFILLFAGTTWMMYRLTSRLFGERAGAIAALILNVTPVLSLSSGGWVLPDGPLMFWMLASALCLERVLLPPRSEPNTVRSVTAWWMAAGACAGLAMLSKYHGAFLFAGTGLFLLTDRHARRWLRHPGPYLGALVAASVVFPVLFWNAQHDWISFRFQGGRGMREGLHLAPLLQNIGGQLGYLLPWICIPLAWVLGVVLMESVRNAWGHVPRDDERTSAARWWLWCLAIGPIAVFTLVALRGQHGLPHWQAPGWLMVIPLLAERVDTRLARGSARAARRTRLWLVGSSVAFALLLLALATQTALGWANRLSPSLFAKGDPSLELLDWSDLPTAIAPLLRDDSAHPGTRPFVAATNWLDAGKISYALNGRAEVVCLCSEPHHFAYVHDSRAYLTRDAVIVERARLRPPSSVPLSKNFQSVTPLGSTVMRRNGSPATTLLLYRGETLVAEVPARVP